MIGWPAPPASIASWPVWMPKTRRDLIATVVVVGPDHVRVPRATIGQVLLERTELTERMRAIPTTTDDDNRVSGFRLYAIRPDSLAAHVGLHNFDQVLSLDELPFDSEEHVVAAYHRAQAAPVFALHYTRGAVPHTLVVEVTP